VVAATTCILRDNPLITDRPVIHHINTHNPSCPPPPPSGDRQSTHTHDVLSLVHSIADDLTPYDPKLTPTCADTSSLADLIIITNLLVATTTR
jgi:hypothetical protein